MKKVYFDESGNTGGNLLDANDTVFSLAACHFTADEEKALLEHFEGFAGPELKFSRLRKSPAGQRMVLAFLEAPEISAQTVAVAAFHKPFMIVTKYCDLVLEPAMQKVGIDFYKRGINIATSNLLHLTMPAYLSPVTWRGFLESFVRVVRERTSAVFNEFRLSAELIYAYLSNKKPSLADMVAPVLLLQTDGSDLFSRLNEDELDPLVPAYHALVSHWGDVLGEPFEMVADESKMLVKERERLLRLSQTDLRSVRAGYDQRQVQYPLKLAAVVAANSHAEKQVQLADVIAGAVAAFTKAEHRHKENTFENKLMHVCLKKAIVVNAIWPDRNLVPQALVNQSDDTSKAVDLATYTGKILHGDADTKLPAPPPTGT